MKDLDDLESLAPATSVRDVVKMIARILRVMVDNSKADRARIDKLEERCDSAAAQRYFDARDEGMGLR